MMMNRVSAVICFVGDFLLTLNICRIPYPVVIHISCETIKGLTTYYYWTIHVHGHITIGQFMSMDIFSMPVVRAAPFLLGI